MFDDGLPTKRNTRSRSSGGIGKTKLTSTAKKKWKKKAESHHFSYSLYYFQILTNYRKTRQFFPFIFLFLFFLFPLFFTSSSFASCSCLFSVPFFRFSLLSFAFCSSQVLFNTLPFQVNITKVENSRPGVRNVDNEQKAEEKQK